MESGAEPWSGQLECTCCIKEDDGRAGERVQVPGLPSQGAELLPGSAETSATLPLPGLRLLHA